MLGRRLSLGLMLLVFAMGAVLAAAGPGPVQAGAPSRPSVTITITDSGVSMPTAVPAGYTAFTVINAGTMPHEASFAKFNPGVTLQQAVAFSEATVNSTDIGDFIKLLQLVQFYGGVTAIAPGDSTQVVLNLTAGNYGVADTQAFDQGVYAGFTVSGPPVETTPPLADVTITEREFAFDAPATVAAGTHTFEVRNTGQQSHELALMTLDPGYTLQDVLTVLQSGGPDEPPPPWIHEAPSVDAQAPGLTQWVTLTLTPGTYVMLCFMPDVNTGMPHALEGMVGTFTVQ